MKIKSIKLDRFKRFTDLTIADIPQKIKLVILAGPNGCGKSSLFDALHTWHRENGSRFGGNWDPDFHGKQDNLGDVTLHQSVNVEFYPPIPTELSDKKKAIYIRSAYRNDPDFSLSEISRVGLAVDERRINRLIDNDTVVSSNYKRLVSQGLEDIYENESPNTTIGDFRKKSIGEIQDAMQSLFDDLALNSLGSPLLDGTFRFSKGVSKAFSYKNLSGGEKAAFDLILDLIVKKREYDDTVFCIDEPEVHMNTKLQGKLLEELYRLIPDNSQLWIATHSIGMMRKARDLEEETPGSVAFINMGDRDFDTAQVLKPVAPDRNFWKRVLHVALDDLSELVAPRCIVICEGRPLGTPGQSKRAAIDAKCYDLIFGHEYPEVRFLSSGSSNEVIDDKIALMETIESLVSGTKVFRLIDRDDHSPEAIVDFAADGTRVLSMRHLESYMYDDEVIEALCQRANMQSAFSEICKDKKDAIDGLIRRSKPKDDIKSASSDIYRSIKKHLNLTGVGNDSTYFMQATLAPLIKPEMAIYQQLKADIFGE